MNAGKSSSVGLLRGLLMGTALAGLFVTGSAAALDVVLEVGDATDPFNGVTSMVHCTTTNGGSCEQFGGAFEHGARGIAINPFDGNVVTLSFKVDEVQPPLQAWEWDGLSNIPAKITNLPQMPGIEEVVGLGFGAGLGDRSLGLRNDNFLIFYQAGGTIGTFATPQSFVANLDAPPVGFSLAEGGPISADEFQGLWARDVNTNVLLRPVGEPLALFESLNLEDRPVPFARDIFPVVGYAEVREEGGGATPDNPDNPFQLVLQSGGASGDPVLWIFQFQQVVDAVTLHGVRSPQIYGMAAYSICDHASTDVCDGRDNDCNGVVDDGFVPSTNGACAACPAMTVCVGGSEFPSECAKECTPALPLPDPTQGGAGWKNGPAALDFDVAADKLCLLPGTSGAFGVQSAPVCLTQLNAVGDVFQVPPDFPGNCNLDAADPTALGRCFQNKISMDPNGRVWASSPVGVYTQIGGTNALVLVAGNPPGCTSITQLEEVGPANQEFMGARARPFAICNQHLWELVPETQTWIDRQANASSMGASPSNGFDLFYNGSLGTNRALTHLSTANTATALSGLDQGGTAIKVGGVYLASNEYDVGRAVGNPGLISQWDGTKIGPVADLTLPLAVPLPSEKYSALAVETSFLHDLQDAPNQVPMKVVEGGGVGVGGPSEAGLTDVVWVLNNTFRLFVYNIAPIPQDFRSGLSSSDPPPVTAFSLFLNNLPPIAECKVAQVSAGSACTAIVDPSLFDADSFDPDGGPVELSIEPATAFGLGVTDVQLTVADNFSSSMCSTQVTVVDNTAPVITAPANVSVSSCAASATVNVGKATATDNCASTPSVTGKITVKNGADLPQPIDVTSGQANLGPGTYGVLWTASDGVNTSMAIQVVTVTTSIEANGSFVLDDRAQFTKASGGFATVFNAGAQQTSIGNDAHSGPVFSVGPITVNHRAHVDGDLTSAQAVSAVSDAVISGTIHPFSAVALPGLPSLPAFPAPTSGNLTVNSGVFAPHAGASYGTVILNSGAEMDLGAGDYFFVSLTINSAVKLRATASTRLFVQNQLIERSSFTTTSGAPQPIYLGYGGDNMTLEAAFTGTFLAPNADITLGTGSATTFAGSFFARGIEVRSGSTLVCG